MNYYVLVGLFNGVVVLFAALAIILKKSHLNFYRSFLAFSVSVGLWSVFYALWQIQTTHDPALFWMRVAMFMIYPSCFGFLWFVMDICGIKKNKIQKSLMIGLPILFMVFSFSSLMVKEVAPKLTFSYWPVPGELMHLYVFSFFSCVFICFLLLIITYFQSVGAHRWQIKWVIFTMAPAWVGGSTNWLLWYGIEFPPLPNFFVGVGWLLLAYAMLRIRLFDVDVLADYVQEARLSAIGLLTSSIHHEIKSPVFVMKGIAENCLEKLDTFSFKTKEELEFAIRDMSHRMIKQSDRVLEIIRSFRDLAKRPASRLFEVRSIQLKDVLRNIRPMIQGELDSREIELEFDIPDSVSIMGDFYSVEEIFLNLILNACQALHETPNPKIVLTGSVLAGRELTPMVSTNPESRKANPVVANSVVITVSDNGPGISAKDLDRIFEPFYTTKASGTGLGLYVAKELVRRNGGQIKVASKLGKGTSFSFEFVCPPKS